MSTPRLRVRDLTLGYGSFVLMRDVNFDVAADDIFLIMGGSGCGKSSLLRTLMGLKQPQSGQVLYGDTDIWACTEKERRRILRRTGVLFQGGALWSSMIYGKGCKGNYVTMAKLAKKLPVFPYVSNQRSMLYIENLTEFVRLLIDDEAAGIFCPQNNEYTNTSDMVNWIAHANGKGILMVKGFTWALKLLRFFSPAVDKAFGSLCYDFALSRYSRDYCVKTLEQSILETEKT